MCSVYLTCSDLQKSLLPQNQDDCITVHLIISLSCSPFFLSPSNSHVFSYPSPHPTPTPKERICLTQGLKRCSPLRQGRWYLFAASCQLQETEGTGAVTPGGPLPPASPPYPPNVSQPDRAAPLARCPAFKRELVGHMSHQTMFYLLTLCYWTKLTLKCERSHGHNVKRKRKDRRDLL